MREPESPCVCNSGRLYRDCCLPADSNTRREEVSKHLDVRVGGAELYGRRSAWARVVKIVEGNSLDYFVWRLTSLMQLIYGEKSLQELDEKLRPAFLDRTQLARFDAFRKKSGDRGNVFTEQGVLLLLQICRKLSPVSGQPFEFRKDLDCEIAKATLAINDILSDIDGDFARGDGLPRLDQLRMQTPLVVRQQLFGNSDQVRYALPRAYIVFANMMRHTKPAFDVPAYFDTNFPFSLEDFLLAASMAFFQFSQQEYNQWNGDNFRIDRVRYFENIKVRREPLDAALAALSMDAKATSAELPSQGDAKGWRDLAYGSFDLRKRPLLSLGNFLYCGNVSFVEDLFWSWPYYAVIDDLTAKGKSRKPFFDAFGEAFEDYVQDLGAYAFGTKFRQITMKSNVPLDDGVIDVAPDWLAVVEVKGARPTVALLLGEQPLTEVQDFETKIRPGIQQLADRIGEYLSESGFKGRISPILVTSGFLPFDPIIWELINTELVQTGIYKLPNVDAPIVCDPVGWEVLCALVKSGTELGTMLNARLTKTHWKSGPFKTFLYEYIGRPDREPMLRPLISLYGDIVDKLAQRLGPTKLVRDEIGPGEWRAVFPSVVL